MRQFAHLHTQKEGEKGATNSVASTIILSSRSNDEQQAHRMAGLGGDLSERPQHTVDSEGLRLEQRGLLQTSCLQNRTRIHDTHQERMEGKDRAHMSTRTHINTQRKQEEKQSS